jgi:hypothetical protein
MTRLKTILEFWEWQKNIYGQNKWEKDSLNTLTKANSDNFDYDPNKYYVTKLGDKIKIIEISNGKYIGKDENDNEVTGNISDLEI